MGNDPPEESTENSTLIDVTPEVEVREHVVPEGTPQDRLDRYAFRVFELVFARKDARRLIRKERIFLNGEMASPSRYIRPGDVIRVIGGLRRPPRVFPCAMQVVYEDDWIAVIVKPPGLHVNGNRHRTVEHALPHNLTPSEQEDRLPWPRPCHRLDLRTGGLLVCAKTAEALRQLGWQFQRREVQKRYHAILVGRLEGEGELDKPVGGRSARTRYRVLGHTRSLHTEWLTSVEMWPETGRQHQLRKHMSGLGHPIIGDDLHGAGKGPVLRGQGLFLRAVQLEVRHPEDDRPMCWELEEPDKFRRFRERETRRWNRWHAEASLS
jgi:RluA family pseudouridine synthase